MSMRKPWAVFPLLLVAAVSVSTSLQAQALLTTPGDGDRVFVITDPLMATSVGDADAVTGLPVDAQPHAATWIDDRYAMVADFQHSRVHLIDTQTRSVTQTINTLFDRYNGTGSLTTSPDGSVVLGFGQRNTQFNDKIVVLRAPFDGPVEYLTPAAGLDALASYRTQGIVFDTSGRAFVQGVGAISVIDPPYTAANFKMRHGSPPAATESGVLLLSADQQTLLSTNGRDVIEIYRAPFAAEQVPDASFSMTWSSGGGNVGSLLFLPGTDRLLVARGGRPELAVVTGLLAGAPVIEELVMPAALDNVCGDAGDTACPGFEHAALDPEGQFVLLTGNSVDAQGRAPMARLLLDGDDIAIETLPVDSSDPALRGRGSGAVVLAPAASVVPDDDIFADGYED